MLGCRRVGVGAGGRSLATFLVHMAHVYVLLLSCTSTKEVSKISRIANISKYHKKMPNSRY